MARRTPHDAERGPLPYSPNPAGTRFFRVTHRNIDQQTAVYIADTPDDAIADDATMVTVLGREHIHEVVECVELVPQGSVVWRSGPEVVS